MIISGIYSISCQISGKRYIGCAKDILKRWRSHRNYLLLGKHINTHLQNAWNKYGEENFNFEILEKCPLDILLSREHFWCLTLKSHDREYGYNILPTDPNKKNSSHSEETREKLRRKTFRHTEEAKMRMSKYRKGKKQSDEWIRKRMISHIGHKRSLETIEKMVKSHERIINQFNLQMVKLGEYRSVKLAAEAVNAKPSALYRCLVGINKTSSGFIWKYNPTD